jgi:hypothetical protein
MIEKPDGLLPLFVFLTVDDVFFSTLVEGGSGDRVTFL